jgi:uncharacterized membrane protein
MEVKAVNHHKVKKLHECVVCKNKFPPREVEPLETISESLLKAIKSTNPSIVDEHGYICQTDLNKIRRDYFKQLIKEEKGDLTEIEKAVYEALKEHEILSRLEIKKAMKEKTLGEALSDRIAQFGGSWSFIILCFFALAIWIVWNSRSSFRFDPYPFILLNLFLSCVAALQAPIIMMSQNRQQERDRLRQEQDYKVNLKSEVEIRILNEKIDKLISHQWQRLLEIQEMQMDFMEELTSKKSK